MRIILMFQKQTHTWVKHKEQMHPPMQWKTTPYPVSDSQLPRPSRGNPNPIQGDEKPPLRQAMTEFFTAWVGAFVPYGLPGCWFVFQTKE